MKKWKIVLADNNNSNILTSDGFYTDIVDFPNETNTGQDLSKRDEYVKTFFFLDLENDITAALLRENPKESENEGKFSLSIKNSKFSFDELLMKNYACLVTFDSNGVETKREYIHIFLTSFTKGEEGMVSYNYIVDLPMTYPQEYETKQETETFIERSHTQNYNLYGYIYEGANILTEENFDDLEPGFLDSQKQPIFMNWRNFSDELSSEALERLNKIVWVFIFKKVPSGENPSNIFLGQYKNIPDFTNLACQVFLAPIQNNMEIIPIESTTGTQWGGWDVLKDSQSDENVISIQPVDNFLLDYSKYFSNISYDSTTGKLTFKVIEFASGIVVNGLLKVSSIYDFNSSNKIFTSIPILDSPIYTLPTEPAQIKNEVKLFTSIHRSYQIISVNSESVSFAPEWIKKNDFFEVEIFPFFSYSPDKTTLAYMVEEKNNENFITKKGSFSSEVIELQQTAQPVDDFFIKNKIGFITGMVTGTVGLGAGVFREGRRIGRNRRFGKNKKSFNGNRNTSGILTTIAGYKFLNSIANVGDLANQPSQSKNTLNSVIYYLQVGNKLSAKTIFGILRNNDSEMKIAFKYYLAMGHNYSNFGDFNKLKLGNYHYNYLQTTNLFQNLKQNLSAKLNSIISNNFSEGVRIWHYRNKESWCGINNFEFENTSMILLNISTDENVILFNLIVGKVTANNLSAGDYHGVYNGFNNEVIYSRYPFNTNSIGGWTTIQLQVTQELKDKVTGGKTLAVYFKQTIKSENDYPIQVLVIRLLWNTIGDYLEYLTNLAPFETKTLQIKFTLDESKLIVGDYLRLVIAASGSITSFSISFDANSEGTKTLFIVE